MKLQKSKRILKRNRKTRKNKKQSTKKTGGSKEEYFLKTAIENGDFDRTKELINKNVKPTSQMLIYAIDLLYVQKQNPSRQYIDIFNLLIEKYGDELINSDIYKKIKDNKDYIDDAVYNRVVKIYHGEKHQEMKQAWVIP